MAKKTPPPQTLTAQILALKPGDDHLFDKNPTTSVRASISRIKLVPEYKRRDFVTRLEGKHTHVWRLQDLPK